MRGVHREVAANGGNVVNPEAEKYPFPALRARIAQLAAEGRDAEREAASCELADLIMRGPQGFNPGRHPLQNNPKSVRLRYPVIEAS